MQTKTVIILAILFIILLAGAGVTGYFRGFAEAGNTYQAQLAAASAEWESERAGYKQALGAVKDGVDRVTAGLAGAISIAAGATDRGIRIAYLVDGIDAALRELGIIFD